MEQPQKAQQVANVMRQQAETIAILISNGFDKTKVVKAVTDGDLAALAAETS